MTTDEELFAHEVECHHFTEPLKPPAKPPSTLKRLAVAAVSGKVWFRVGWTCTCVVRVLETAEQEMLLRGLIQNSLDIYQLQGTASASAGTHSKPGAYDIGQYSDAQIDVQRLAGGDGQHRTTAQGFDVDHCHGFAQGCPHGSDSLMAQKRAWNKGRNGLVSNGPVEGRWPTQDWQTAVAERGKIIMGLLDDYAKKAADQATARTVAILLPAINAIPGKTVNSVAIEVGTDPKTKKKVFWSLGHIDSWLFRSVASKNQLAAAQSQITTLQAQVTALKALVNGLVTK